ncbi:MAG: 30S ribosome-binding factor RbfA [Planctomycetota bacterium]
MGSIKIERLREKIKVECARVIMTKINDPRAGFLTVQNVELSKDLRHAKVYVSILGEDAQRRKVMRMLKDATGFIQREVAGTLRTRVTPALAFVLDTSIDKSFKVAAILEQIKKDNADRGLPEGAVAKSDDDEDDDEDAEGDDWGDDEDDDEEE